MPKLVPELRDKCDIVVVDGGHDAATAWQDTINMRVRGNVSAKVLASELLYGKRECSILVVM